jgi:hypothetical protein
VDNAKSVAHNLTALNNSKKILEWLLKEKNKDGQRTPYEALQRERAGTRLRQSRPRQGYLKKTPARPSENVNNTCTRSIQVGR